jgi:hypothetical protein
MKHSRPGRPGPPAAAVRARARGRGGRFRWLRAAASRGYSACRGRTRRPGRVEPAHSTSLGQRVQMLNGSPASSDLRPPSPREPGNALDSARQTIGSVPGARRRTGWTDYQSGWAVHQSGWAVDQSGWAVDQSGWAVHQSGWAVDQSDWAVYQSDWAVINRTEKPESARELPSRLPERARSVRRVTRPARASRSRSCSSR